MHIINDIHEDTTVSYDVWINDIDDIHKTVRGSVIDTDAVDYLKEVTVAYLIEPVGYYNNVVVEARTRKATDFSDIVQFKEGLLSSGKKIIMYKVQWNYPMPNYHKIDENYQMVLLDNGPIISAGYWLVRYAEL